MSSISSPGPGGAPSLTWPRSAAPRRRSIVTASDGNPLRLRWCRFATNDRLICQITGMTLIESQLVAFSRLIAVDSNGQNVTLLGQHNSDYDARLRQYGGSIVDWLTPADGAVLMQHDYVPEAGRIGTLVSRTADGVGIDRVDIRTLRATVVERPNPRAGGYISDGRGHVRIMIVPSVRGSTDQMGTRTDYLYRTEAGHDWQPFASYDDATGEGMIPIAVDAGLNAAYVLKKLNGRFALYRVKLDGSMATELVYANEHVDVDDVVWASHGSRVIGVTFAEEQRGIVYFDSVYAGLARSLGRAIPTLPLIGFGNASADGNRIIVSAASDTDAGRYYVYDRATHSLNAILIDRPQLDGVPPAPVRAVTYAAADGVNVPAYLTLPPNSDGPQPAGRGPAAWRAGRARRTKLRLARPISRPSGLCRAAAQLSRLGAAMATTGCSRTASAAGAPRSATSPPARAGWPRRASPIRTGWRSLAGPMAAMRRSSRPRPSPACYKAVVAIAPVTDLQLGDRTIFAAMSSAATRPIISAAGRTSPRARRCAMPAAITAPVLLFHGDRDTNVNVIHSRADGRGAARRRPEQRADRLSGPRARSGRQRGRVRMLTRIGTFLAAPSAARAAISQLGRELRSAA